MFCTFWFSCGYCWLGSNDYIFLKVTNPYQFQGFFFQIKCVPRLILCLTEKCHRILICLLCEKKSAFSMPLLNGSSTGPLQVRSFEPTEPLCKSHCSFALLAGFGFLCWHGIEMINFLFGFLMLQAAGLLWFQLCCFCWKMSIGGRVEGRHDAYDSSFLLILG